MAESCFVLYKERRRMSSPILSTSAKTGTKKNDWTSRRQHWGSVDCVSQGPRPGPILQEVLPHSCMMTYCSTLTAPLVRTTGLFLSLFFLPLFPSFYPSSFVFSFPLHSAFIFPHSFRKCPLGHLLNFGFYSVWIRGGWKVVIKSGMSCLRVYIWILGWGQKRGLCRGTER